jgi:hypothetical protein
VDPEDPTARTRQDLAQVVDLEALEGSAGARGRLRIAVPESWEAGDELIVVAPARVVCDRCDGGGCDGCNRSGALRTPEEPSARALHVQLPDLAGRTAAVRLVRPFGEASTVEQLIVELSRAPEGTGAPAGVTRVERVRTQATAPAPRALIAAAGGLAALAAAAAAIAASC